MASPLPDKITLYDKDGNATEHFPVDVTEIIAGGGYTREKPETAKDDDSKRETDPNAAKTGQQAEGNKGEVVPVADKAKKPK